MNLFDEEPDNYVMAPDTPASPTKTLGEMVTGVPSHDTPTSPINGVEINPAGSASPRMLDYANQTLATEKALKDRLTSELPFMTRVLGWGSEGANREIEARVNNAMSQAHQAAALDQAQQKEDQENAIKFSKDVWATMSNYDPEHWPDAVRDLASLYGVKKVPNSILKQFVSDAQAYPQQMQEAFVKLGLSKQAARELLTNPSKYAEFRGKMLDLVKTQGEIDAKSQETRIAGEKNEATKRAAGVVGANVPGAAGMILSQGLEGGVPESTLKLAMQTADPKSIPNKVSLTKELLFVTKAADKLGVQWAPGEAVPPEVAAEALAQEVEFSEKMRIPLGDEARTFYEVLKRTGDLRQAQSATVGYTQEKSGGRAAGAAAGGNAANSAPQSEQNAIMAGKKPGAAAPGVETDVSATRSTSIEKSTGAAAGDVAKNIAGLQKLRPVVDNIELASSYLNRAKTSPETIAQGVTIAGQKFTNADQLAKYYEESIPPLRAQFARTIGSDVGNMAASEQAAWDSAFPTKYDSDAQSKAKVEFLRVNMGISEAAQRARLKNGGVVPEETQQMYKARLMKAIDNVEKAGLNRQAAPSGPMNVTLPNGTSVVIRRKGK